jgi:hypothetical protein
MKEAKEETKREGNSVNWKILTGDGNKSETISHPVIHPLLIDKKLENNKPSFKEVLERCNLYSKKLKLSNSEINRVMTLYYELKEKAEEEMELLCASEFEKNMGYLLVDNFFRNNNKLNFPLMFSMFELMGLKGNKEG